MLDLLKNYKKRQPISKDAPVPDKPLSLYGESSGREGCYSLIYISNGASGHRYGKWLEKSKADAEIYEGLGGRADICIVQYISKGTKLPELYNGFRHDKGSFEGFALRVKAGGSWMWYCTDESWHRTSYDMPDKKLFRSGARPDVRIDGELFPEPPEVYIFEPVWRGRGGKTLFSASSFFSDGLMAHALGGLDEACYHNTPAAYQNSINNGFKLYEIDLSMTVDGRLVACHGWSETNCTHTGMEYSPELADTMTYDKLMGMTIHGNPQMDAREFYAMARKNKSHHFETDIHPQTGEASAAVIREMLEDFNYDPELLDRLIIQAYSKDMFEGIDKVWHFRNYIYSLRGEMNVIDEVIDFLLDSGIGAIAIRAHYTIDDRVIALLHNAGICILAYTVLEDTAECKGLLDKGVDSICTDFVTPEALKNQKTGLGNYPFYVKYNSNTKDAEYKPDFEAAEESKVVTKAGNLEYHDPEEWSNDGTKCLAECMFTSEGKEFVGWLLRMRIDRVRLWYCNDGLFHKKKEVVKVDSVEPYIFKAGEPLPVLPVKSNGKLFIYAVWKDAETGKYLLDL